MLGFMGMGLMVLALPWTPWPFAFWSLFAGVGRRAPSSAAWESGSQPAADCSSTSARLPYWRQVRRVYSAKLAHQLSMHLAAARFERLRQVRPELGKELVMRGELFLPCGAVDARQLRVLG